jgi:hypothetical protein
MDLHKAKIQLEKINSLYKSMAADVNNISSIERDLMMSYVRQLYESFLDLSTVVSNKAPDVEIIKTTPKLTLKKPDPVAEPVKEMQPPLRSAVQPDAGGLEDEPPAPAPPPPPPSPPKVVEAKPSPVPSPAPKPVNVDTPPVDGELEELFAFTTAKELSEKLSELPVTDIKKAMGLNERIFTVNELFGGDQAAFDESLNALNRMADFEEAKRYLIEKVAGKYGWASKDKKSKAKNFIKLVKRRYN